jgi:uncharacterized repeat protein (TIGR03803 family)
MNTTKVQADASHSPIRRLTSGSVVLAMQFLWLLLVAPPLRAQTFTVLHTFTGKGDGKSPSAGVIRDSYGTLYGTTGRGGSFDRGTTFKLVAQGKETILHNFWCGDGWEPSGALIRDQRGIFYGTTYEGGTPDGGGCFYGCGAVFKLDKTGKETVLYAFSGLADGSSPSGQLVRDAAGNLYGVTQLGGTRSCNFLCGVVFKVDKNGKEKVLHAFTGLPDGNAPNAGLIRDKAGNLYGVTPYGGVTTYCGDYGCGIVFKVDATGKETVLYRFTGGTDGDVPNGSLVRDTAGNLYGVTGSGGDLSSCPGGGKYSGGCGVIFKLDTAGKETVLYAFKGSPDGAFPKGRLLRDKSGSLYGVTVAGGTTGCNVNQGCGTIFKVDANGIETVLYTFTGGSDGANPNGDLVMDASGNLYGTTSSGGDSSCYQGGGGCGLVFKLTP